MAASLISYFCTMVTACTILIALMSQFVSPPTFRQPHPIAAFKHSHKAGERGESPSAQSSATPSSARESEAVSSEPQKEKQAQYRPRRPSPKARARDPAWSAVAQLHPWQDQWNYR